MERCVGEGSVEDLHAPPRSFGIPSMHVSILLLVLIRAPQRLPPPRWLSWGLERRGPSDRSCAFERERDCRSGIEWGRSTVAGPTWVHNRRSIPRASAPTSLASAPTTRLGRAKRRETMPTTLQTLRTTPNARVGMSARRLARGTAARATRRVVCSSVRAREGRKKRREARDVDVAGGWSCDERAKSEEIGPQDKNADANDGVFLRG